MLAVIAESLQAMQVQIALLDREIASRAKADPVAKRLMTILGVGPVIATALAALAPAASRRLCDRLRGKLLLPCASAACNRRLSGSYQVFSRYELHYD